MGRQNKLVIDKDGFDRREAGYYSTPDFVSEFIADRLISLNPTGRVVLDPCIGQGEMTTIWKQRERFVIGFDVVNRFPTSCDIFKEEDFLEHHMNLGSSNLFNAVKNTLKPDYIVANPPYNCHESDYIRSRKSALKDAYGTSALNMYSMFLKSIIDIAPKGCVIGVIVHDSFLTAHGHSELRKYIRNNCAIHDIHLCPTNLFLYQGADVRTCILVLQKDMPQIDKIRVSNRSASIEDFKLCLKNRNFEQITVAELTLNAAQDNDEFVIGAPGELKALFNDRRLSEIAPCVTGISTGNDKKYLSAFKTDCHTIPFYKNPAKRIFYTEPDAFLIFDFLEEEKKTKNFMVRNKSFMFKGGLTCSSMGIHFGAAILPPDGAFGVNPNIIVEDEFTRWWLLSYLNSGLCFYLVRGMIIRTNMITAGYASRIPVPHFEASVLNKLAQLGQSAFELAKSKKSLKTTKDQINVLIQDSMGFSSDTNDLLCKFANNAIRLT